MSAIGPNQRPRLMPGCRLSELEAQRGTLVIPEGALRLNGPALKIVQYCDGTRTFAEILTLLRSEFAMADPARIEQDASDFLQKLLMKRVVSCEEG